MMRRKQFVLTGTSPASASTAAVGAVLGGLSAFDFFQIDAIITGGTGGTVDLYIQRQVDKTNDVWLDWVHFAQVSAATTKRYTVSSAGNGTITEVGQMNTALSGSLVLAAGTCVGGHPGDAVRLVATAGSGTSAGQTQTVYITCFEELG